MEGEKVDHKANKKSKKKIKKKELRRIHNEEPESTNNDLEDN